MVDGIETTLERAAQLADRVLSMGCSEFDHALVDHECPIDEAMYMLEAIIECRQYWDWQKSKAPEVCGECGERIPDDDAVWHYHAGVVIGGGADGR